MKCINSCVKDDKKCVHVFDFKGGWVQISVDAILNLDLKKINSNFSNELRSARSCRIESDPVP